jgi:hypothetical protein
MPAKVLDRKSVLWMYMSQDIKDLIEDGELLLNFVLDNKDKTDISDFSFLVFSFAKAYEGFLKKFLMDLGMITHDEFYGDEIRIGRILNPKYMKEHGNVINKMCDHSEGLKNLSELLWLAWKKGRNRVFHYFPHNFRKLSYEEADEIIDEMMDVMAKCVEHCKVSIADLSD